MMFYAFQNIGIGIAIGNTLFERYKLQLRYIFSSVEIMNRPVQGLKYLAIYSSSDVEYFDLAVSSVVYDPPQESAFFFFTGVIKEFLKSLPGIVVLHGGAVRINGENWLVLAPRRYGKSTLISHLVFACGAEYMDDDTIVIANHAYNGLGFPIYSRMIEEPARKSVVAITIDSDNEQRYVATPPKVLRRMNRIDKIIFPRFLSEIKNTSIRQIRGINIVKRLLENCAYYSNQHECLAEFADLALTNAYEIDYSDFGWIESIGSADH